MKTIIPNFQYQLVNSGHEFRVCMGTWGGRNIPGVAQLDQNVCGARGHDYRHGYHGMGCGVWLGVEGRR